MKKVYVVETKVCDYEDFVWDEVTPKVEAICETYELAREYVDDYLREEEDDDVKEEGNDSWTIYDNIRISIREFKMFQSKEEF